jgi:hypothetical protein
MLCSDSDSGLGVASNGVLPPGLSFSYRDNESYALAPGTTMCGPGNVGSLGGIHVDSGHAYASGYPLTGVAALTYTPAPDTSLVRFTIFMPIWLGPPEYREGVTVHGGDPSTFWRDRGSPIASGAETARRSAPSSIRSVQRT